MLKNHYRWIIVALAFCGSIVNFIDRSALSYAKLPLQTQFHFNDMDFGIIAAAFGVGYAIMAPISGFLIDKYGTHRSWFLAAVAWSFATLLMGFADGFLLLMIARALLGVSEAPAFPTLGKVMHDWLPSHEQGRALGFAFVAVPFASVIGAPLISHLIVWFNWKVLFFILGGIGFVWALFWWGFAANNPQESIRTQAVEKNYIATHQTHLHEPAVATNWKSFLHPALLANNYGFFTFGYTLSFALVWLPGFFQKTYGLTLAEIGHWMMIPWLVASVMIFSGGYLMDYLWKKTRNTVIARSHLIWITQLISALCFLPVVLWHPSFTTAITFVALGLGFSMSNNAAFYALNSDYLPKKTASSIGIMIGVYALANVFSPLLTGWLSTVTGNFKSAIILLLCLSVSSALAIICFQVMPDRKTKNQIDNNLVTE